MNLPIDPDAPTGEETLERAKGDAEGNVEELNEALQAACRWSERYKLRAEAAEGLLQDAVARAMAAEDCLATLARENRELRKHVVDAAGMLTTVRGLVADAELEDKQLRSGRDAAIARAEAAEAHSREVVICAAVLANGGRIFRCHRHHDGLRALSDGGIEMAEHDRAQGFITSRGRYVGRREALELQRAAGIPSVAPGGYRGQLFSEDLY